MRFGVRRSHSLSFQITTRCSAALAILMLTWSVPAGAYPHCYVAAGNPYCAQPPFPPPTSPPGTPSGISAPASATHPTAGTWTVSWGTASGSPLQRR